MLTQTTTAVPMLQRQRTTAVAGTRLYTKPLSIMSLKTAVEQYSTTVYSTVRTTAVPHTTAAEHTLPQTLNYN